MFSEIDLTLGGAHAIDMQLSDFIREKKSEIIKEWVAFAATLAPAAEGMNDLALRDHAEEILEAIVSDLERPQDRAQQTQKSKGHGEEHRMQAVGKAHAAVRIEDGFKLSQLVAEYRALRATVLRLFARAGGRRAKNQLHQVTRFNEAVDEALVEATNRYMLVINRTSDEFLAVLGHDLRNPLGAILTSAALMTARGLEGKNVKAASRILTSAERMKRMVTDLLDLTRTRLGSGLRISPEQMDLGSLCREMLSELHAFHPDRRLDFRSEGDLRGTWDQDRLAQVLSNLVSNAIQHGDRASPVTVAASVDGDEVVIEVHNEGPPIPRALLANIFEPMVRRAEEKADKGSTSLGLGLHIARQIVLAHSGSVSVKSTDRTGTTFTVRLPRYSAAVHGSPGAGKSEDRHDASGELVVPPNEPAANSVH